MAKKNAQRNVAVVANGMPRYCQEQDGHTPEKGRVVVVVVIAER
jgi:hypothetical protein